MGGRISQSKARIKVSTYIGDGAATRAITGVGFQADCVIVGDFGTSAHCWLKSQAMAVNAKNLSTSAYTADVITSIDLNGFTVTVGGSLNTLNVTYFYIAMKS